MVCGSRRCYVLGRPQFGRPGQIKPLLCPISLMMLFPVSTVPEAQNDVLRPAVTLVSIITDRVIITPISNNYR